MRNFFARLFRGCRTIKARPDWIEFVGNDWPDTIMTVIPTDDFHEKQGRSTCRWIIKKNGQQLSVYLKRHYQLPWWQGLFSLLFPWAHWAPGLQEWRHLNWAEAQGIPVPTPVAGAEYAGPGWKLQSMLAIKELADMLPLHQAIPYAQDVLAPSDFLTWKKALVVEMARLSRKLHTRNHFHKDLYLCHFYLPRAVIYGWAGQYQRESLQGDLHLIDFHRLGHHPVTRTWWQIKDLAQLLYSTDVEGVTTRDCIRFWRLYRQGSRRGLRTKFFEWCIRVKWWRYKDHNEKRLRRIERQSSSKKEAAA
ncbi:MAG: lipopolysaccharide kinase InaA family protein [Gemmataceae bacterium]